MGKLIFIKFFRLERERKNIISYEQFFCGENKYTLYLFIHLRLKVFKQLISFKFHVTGLCLGKMYFKDL